jgi:branched-subunit amino acid aminotransferase/4-amino-4-deoxychorismate lyase
MDGITRYRVMDVVLYSDEDLSSLAAAFEARGMFVTQRAIEISQTDRMWIFQVGCEQLPDDDIEL